MSNTAALVRVQELDLEADALRARRLELEASRELDQCRAEARELDAVLDSTRAGRETLARAERALAAEVAAVAEKAKDVEATLYSGRVTIPKELEALQDDLQMLRSRQRELEDQELEQLEAIETLEAELAATETRRAALGARAESLAAEVDRAVEEIRSELARIEVAHSEVASRLPSPVLAMYRRLRGNRRLAGRVVAELGDGICRGCRVQLPILEHNRIRAEPPDAVVCCPGCSRLLVR